MRNARRYVVTYALRRNLTLIPPFRPSNSFSLSSSHMTKLPFDVKQSNRRLLHPLSPSLFFLCLLFTAHTIIAFVPLRSLVVLNFRVSEPRRGKKNRGRKRRNVPIDSSSRLKRGTAARYEKRTLAKKGRRGARLRVFRRAIN